MIRAGEPFAAGERLSAGRLAALAVVGELDACGARIQQRDVDDVGLEGLAHPLADQLDERVEVELRGERLHDAVDGLELDRPLPRLLQRAHPLERRADVLADVGELVAVVLGVADRQGIGLHREDADDAARRPQRDAEPVPVLGAGAHDVHHAGLDEPVHVLGMEELWLAAAQYVCGGAPCVADAERFPENRVGRSSSISST